MECKICGAEFDEASNQINLCRHKEGVTHLGCCTAQCSWDGQPCEHSVGVYSKL